MLAKLALVPQSILSSYTDKDAHLAAEGGVYKAGDLVAYFGNCDRPDRNCEAEMHSYAQEVRKKEQGS